MKSHSKRHLNPGSREVSYYAFFPLTSSGFFTVFMPFFTSIHPSSWCFYELLGVKDDAKMQMMESFTSKNSQCLRGVSVGGTYDYCPTELDRGKKNEVRVSMIMTVGVALTKCKQILPIEDAWPTSSFSLLQSQVSDPTCSPYISHYLHPPLLKRNQAQSHNEAFMAHWEPC